MGRKGAGEVGDYLGSRPNYVLFIFCLRGEYSCGNEESRKSERI